MGIEHGGDEEQQKRAELTRGFKVTLRKHLLKNKSTNRQKEKKTLNWKSIKLFEQECASAGTSQDNFQPYLFVCLFVCRCTRLIFNLSKFSLTNGQHRESTFI